MYGKSVFLISVVFVLSILMGVANATEPNLVSRWKFDEDSGVTAYDSAGDNNGVVYDANWTTGQVDGALMFDGDGDYVNVDSPFNLTTHTTSFWIEPNTLHNGTIIEPVKETTRAHGYIALTSEGEICHLVRSGIYTRTNRIVAFTDSVIEEGKWYHIVSIMGSEGNRVYVNGIRRALSYTTGSPSSTWSWEDIDGGNGPDNLYIGALFYDGVGHNYFNGKIDDVRIYNGSLSRQAIVQLYGDMWLLGKAFEPNPYDGAMDLDSRVVLTWLPGDYAASHDVYFGTDYNDVNDASRLAGDIDGDGQVDWYDVRILTEQLLDDPEGLEPSADLNGDGNVNLVDLTIVANDWMECADAVFKGNQDTNSYDPCGLELDTTYYWRIDEVNGPNTWKGDTWRFTVQVVNIKKGPYLLYPGNSDEMTVLWQLDGYVDCTLQWGQNMLYSDGSVNISEYGSDHQHKYTITDLTPATKYYYKVTVGPNSFDGSFRSAPPASATAVKFLAYGDTRTNPAAHDTVNQAMVDTFETDSGYQTFTLHLGDWVASGDSESDWVEQFFDPAYVNTRYMQANLPINGCKGNHENSGTLFKKYWPYPYVSNFYWSFDYGPAHIAVVDQYTSYSTGSAQHTWLENDLSASTKEWKFIILHEPGYSAGGHADNGDVQTYIQPLCETYGVDIVFAGHNHYYARCDENGVKHITTGGGGAPLSDCNPNYSVYVETCTKARHFCKIEIDGDQLDLVAVEPDGTVIDSFTLIH